LPILKYALWVTFSGTGRVASQAKRPPCLKGLLRAEGIRNRRISKAGKKREKGVGDPYSKRKSFAYEVKLSRMIESPWFRSPAPP
jgi:hypothetical protein